MLFTSYDKDFLILIFHNINTCQLQHALGEIMMMKYSDWYPLINTSVIPLKAVVSQMYCLGSQGLCSDRDYIITFRSTNSQRNATEFLPLGQRAVVVAESHLSWMFNGFYISLIKYFSFTAMSSVMI